MFTQVTRDQMLENLRSMLRAALQMRTDGVAYARLSRAHGYLDGYMRGLVEAGLVEGRELVAIVAEERQRVDGPATRQMKRDWVLPEEGASTDRALSDEPAAGKAVAAA